MSDAVDLVRVDESQQPGEFRDIIEKIRREGFVRARVDGQIMELDRPERIPAQQEQTAHH